MKARWSKDLWKLVYDFSRVFLLENHSYRRARYAFNGKRERTKNPEIMTLTDWLKAYDKEKEKEYIELFYSNVQPVIDDHEFFNTYVEKMPKWMKRKSIFYELPYWEHLKIVHLLDPMRIFKNVLSSLWRHIWLK